MTTTKNTSRLHRKALGFIGRALCITALTSALACGGDAPVPGPGPGPAPGPSPASLGKVGEQCTASSDCADKLCIFRGNSEIGICTKQCTDTFDCPFPFSDWNCDYAGGISMKVCIPK